MIRDLKAVFWVLGIYEVSMLFNVYCNSVNPMAMAHSRESFSCVHYWLFFIRFQSPSPFATLIHTLIFFPLNFCYICKWWFLWYFGSMLSVASVSYHSWAVTLMWLVTLVCWLCSGLLLSPRLSFGSRCISMKRLRSHGSVVKQNVCLENTDVTYSKSEVLNHVVL